MKSFNQVLENMNKEGKGITKNKKRTDWGGEKKTL
jgi:hypothetical protein